MLELLSPAGGRGEGGMGREGVGEDEEDEFEGKVREGSEGRRGRKRGSGGRREERGHGDGEDGCGGREGLARSRVGWRGGLTACCFCCLDEPAHRVD